MKLLLGFLVMGAALATAAPVPHWKPAEFEPLVELPWEKPGRSVDQVVEAIFREPDPDIRYPVLLGYLQTLPVADLPKAFDLALEMEGRHEPDRLVAMMLGLWAKRDPRSAWERTKALFKVVGIEDGWLSYDTWAGMRNRITVVDRASLAKSNFWLRRDTLTAFPLGVEESSLSEPERRQYLKDFSTLWIETFSTWPGGAESPLAEPIEAGDVVRAFHRDLVDFQKPGHAVDFSDPRTCFEIGMRRWLASEPKEGLKVIQRIRGLSWPDPAHNLKPRTAFVTPALLLIWAKADPAGLQAWAETTKEKADQTHAWRAKCILMSMVKPEVRDRWLKSLDAMAPDDFNKCLETLADWEPGLAWERAVRSKDDDLIWQIFRNIGCGLWPGHLSNTSRAGCDFIEKIDFTKYPEDVRKMIFEGVNDTRLPEQWGDFDLGACARWGLRYLLSGDSGVPRSNMIALLGGDDTFASDGDIIDRTFCSLRVWAVWRPDEMREWIKTQEGEDLKEALTWLLDHPWGGPKEEGSKAAETGKKN